MKVKELIENYQYRKANHIEGVSDDLFAICNKEGTTFERYVFSHLNHIELSIDDHYNLGLVISTDEIMGVDDVISGVSKLSKSGYLQTCEVIVNDKTWVIYHDHQVFKCAKYDIINEDKND